MTALVDSFKSKSRVFGLLNAMCCALAAEIVGGLYQAPSVGNEDNMRGSHNKSEFVMFG